MMHCKFSLLLFAVVSSIQAHEYEDEQTMSDRKTMVHLFEWKWTDIAKECKNFLQHYGYGAVQVSPPNEHAVIKEHERPWWERYQPVSYKLESRSGTRAEFERMVKECNAVGVRIIVDAVINHMTGSTMKGTGSGGCSYDAGAHSFPCVPFDRSNFNDDCPHGPEGSIAPEDYGTNAHAVRNCRLSGLVDLKTGSEPVRTKIADFLNGMIDMGVAGFRLDASKHMWPADIKAIVSQLKNLNSTIFGPNKRPFIVQEVIDLGGSMITADEYIGQTGRVTNFKYGLNLADAVHRQNDQNFGHYKTFGESWQMWAHSAVLNFVDNHDNQRGHGGGGSILTHKNPHKYQMAATFMLAWPYGYPRVMSSYFFEDTSQGPPNAGKPNYETKSPQFNVDDTCKLESGYVCEHRWPAIRNMAKWREVVGPYNHVADVVTEEHRIAFHRGAGADRHGFFALNNADNNWHRKLQTGLPAGTYCDVISGKVLNDKCSGRSIVVDYSGQGFLELPSTQSFAVHSCSKIGSSCANIGTAEKMMLLGSLTALKAVHANAPVSAGSANGNTVIYFHKQTHFGQNVFIRGGLSGACKGTAGTEDPCSLPIAHVSHANGAQNDHFLDWYGAEAGQDSNAHGTPMQWTSSPFGEHYWKVELKIDCSKTNNSWFEFKGFLNGEWEHDVGGKETCHGDVGGSAPLQSINHAAKCGQVNVFRWGSPSCFIGHA